VVELESKCQIFLKWYQVGHTQTIIQCNFDKLVGKVGLAWVQTIIGLFEWVSLIFFENVIYDQCDHSVFFR
jgi:hypothetical protein